MKLCIWSPKNSGLRASAASPPASPAGIFTNRRLLPTVRVVPTVPFVRAALVVSSHEHSNLRKQGGNMTIKYFEDLEVWKEARRLTREIYRLTQVGKFSRDFALREQI